MRTKINNLFWLTISIIFIGCSQTKTNDKSKELTMNFRASFCDPLNPKIIELGKVQKDNILEKFENTNWTEYLEKMNSAKDENEIYYSPSLEIENSDIKHGLAISAVGNPDNYEFYISYKRPKKLKTFFGLKEKIDDNYVTDIQGQTKQDVIECLKALIRNDTDYLTNKIGQ
jgi:hypothetical protein